MKTKNLIFLFLSVFYWMNGSAQLRITEISYNPPESGNDSLEYIELYNSGAAVLNLRDYKFTKGVDLTFDEILMQPKSYLVVAVNAAAFERNFKKSAVQWTGGALNNNAEIIAIADTGGTEVIAVDYKDTPPWPGLADGTDGNGRSIELCNPDADPNDGANWKASENDLGFQINGKQVYGTPGAANSVSCGVTPDYLVEVSDGAFSPKDIVINEGESVGWNNLKGNNNINGSKNTYPNNPVSFGNGNPSTNNWSYVFTFDTPGYYEYQSDPSGQKGSVTVNKKTVIDPYPYRTMAEVKGVNADGVADSLGIRCLLKGVVHTINFRTSGLQFVIVDDQNKGFAIFNSSNNFGYTVSPGDAVDVKGKIEQFRGLSQLIVDSLKVVSTGNQLVDVKLVNVFEEADESGYIQIQNVSFKDPSEWKSGGSGFNVVMTNGTVDYNVRIVNTSDAFNAPIPSGQTFNVTGVLSQFAGSSAPFTDGYQLQPSYITDFKALSATEDVKALDNIKVSPNPVTHLVKIESAVVPQKIDIVDLSGSIVRTFLDTNSVDFNNISSGVYFIQIRIGDKIITKKIIKL